MLDSLIHARGLILPYGQPGAYLGVNLDVPAGAVVGLIGRNGAGKSTLLRCLLGLEQPLGGVAQLAGEAADALSDTLRERLGYVAQTPDLFGWMTVQEHLFMIGRAYRNWDQQRCLQLAASMGLHSHMQTRCDALSGGDQQKLAVVLALAHAPDLLLLDEPVSSLDPLSRRDFMRAIFAGHDQERSVLISSHILSDLERVVSHVAFMREGRIQLFSEWDAVQEHVRMLPQSVAVPQAAIVHKAAHAKHQLIDTRHAPALAHEGRTLSMDEIFVELNT